MLDYLMTVNGEEVGADLPKMNVSNPATNEIVGTVPNGGKEESALAIDAAYNAFQSWSKLTAYERSNYLKKLNDLLLAHQEELAEIMTLEMGKPLTQSLGEVVYSASFVEWYAEEAKRIYGETIPSHLPNKRLQVWRKPVGVVGA